jgi:flagellar protein FlaJ
MSLETGTGGGSVRSGGDQLGAAFYPLYERLFADDSDFIADVETKLAEARMADTVEMYVARSLGIGVVAGGLLWAVGLLVGLLVQQFVSITLGIPMDPELAAVVETLKTPLLVFVSGLVFGSIGFGIGFGTLIAIPYSRSSARGREINMLLSDAVSFMYALSVGGLNQLEILEAMAQAEDTYGEVALEFQSLVQETNYFDTDYRTAVRKQAMQTPSDELSQFLTDMLSIINSGGDMQSFLDEKKRKHMRTAKQQQELTLETLELFGEMYMTLSLFPLLLVIILVIMGIMGQSTEKMLLGTIYGLTPLLGAGFLVLVSTVKEDDPGDGYLLPDTADERLERQVDSIKSREGTYATLRVLKAPHLFFRENPLFTLALTVPLALVLVAGIVALGAAPTSIDGMIAQPVWGTVVYVYIPIYVVVLPLAVFREWNQRSRYGITNGLSENLRKLSSANDTGQTLLEATKTVSNTSSGKLATEFETMYAKVNYGMSLREALIEFNNKYHVPRLARTVKLISKAQEASSQITDVLTTAAQSSENTDDIERERKSRTLMQVVIIMMTFFTLLAVMAILKTQFLGVMAGLTEQAGGGGGASGGGSGGAFSASVNVDQLSLLFFHAVTMQAILSGLIAGYMREGKLAGGLKYVIVLTTVCLGTWMVVA